MTEIMMAQDTTAVQAARTFSASGPKKLYTGGGWSPARGGATLDVVNPTTERPLASVASASPADVDDAVKSARSAFEATSWQAVSPHDRSRVLLRIADLLDEHCEELAAISSLEMGMPFTQSVMITRQMVDVFQYYAGWTTKAYGRTMPTDGSSFTLTLREPLGVVAVIIPWNGPILYTAWKVAAALATGNTVVLKPAADAPLTCVRFAELMEQADLPRGVFNLITGDGATVGDALVASPEVDMITFTGSTAVGKHIMRTAADTLKKLSLELGGKSPFIIFPDADLDLTLPMALGSFTQNSGQACTAGTRLLVHDSLVEQVVERLTQGAAELRLGDPFDPQTQAGPIISAKQLDRVGSYVDSGRADGADVRTGGRRTDREGFFYEPTVVTNVTPDMRIVREEIFGPVGCVMSFSTQQEALERANQTEYGLAASVWTTNIATAQAIAHGLQAGMIWVNTHFELDVMTPFGGLKQSGLGSELGAESLDEFSRIKSVLMRGA